MPSAGIAAIVHAYGDATDHIYPRGLADITRFFAGLALVPPYDDADLELCKVGLWDAEDPVLADDASARWRWAGVGRTTLETRRAAQCARSASDAHAYTLRSRGRSS